MNHPQIKNQKSRIKNSSWHFVTSCLRVYVSRLHTDTRGAVSVLVLLTIWSLVAILGLVWNTTEQAKRREEIQTAADSAAHSTATLMARAVNAINAQNMVISQDASTETIWRAIPPTDVGISIRLSTEITLANTMKRNGNLVILTRKLQTDLTAIAREYQLTLDAINVLNTGAGANYSGPQEQLDITNHLRQARSALDWANNTYVNGAQPPPAPVGPPPGTKRPGPPGPNGEGLRQLVTNWKPPDENAILDAIINFINNAEMPILRTFENQTRPATSQSVDAQMAAHESEVYQNELAMANMLPDTIGAQRAQLAAFYKTDITLATLKNSPANAGPARVFAPLIPASNVQSITQLDIIRTAYPLDTSEAGLLPVVTVDPFNAHTDENRIWVPGFQVQMDPAVFPNAYTLTTNPPDGWGHMWAMPLEHYTRQRVNEDQLQINTTYMQPLDLSRTVTLAGIINKMMNLPPQPTITPLPGSIPDDQLKPYLPVPPPPPPSLPPPPPPKIYEQINVLPALTAPGAATAAYRTTLALYNQHGAAFTGAINTLRNDLESYTNFFNTFTLGFAQLLWESNVNGSLHTVLKNLGTNRQFMVLSTYSLHYLPDWAKPGMFESAQHTIENELMTINLTNLTNFIVASLAKSDPQGLGTGILDPTYRQTFLTGAYADQAAATADAAIRPTVHQISLLIATEWINRPWPFEITPPESVVLPNRGVTPPDRMREFTLLAAARQTDATAPHLLLPDFFGSPNTKLIAYAQAEAFNWMEFNFNYGSNERFDQIVYIPEEVYYPWSLQHFVGSPHGSRTGSLGGWDWRCAFSLSDALAPAIPLNPEFAQYFNDAGIPNPASGGLNEINLH